jgi:hypothetical protein
MAAIRVAGRAGVPISGLALSVLLLSGVPLAGCAVQPAPPGQPVPSGEPAPSTGAVPSTGLPSTGLPSTGLPSTGLPSSAGGVQPFPVYYVGQTGAGPRLYRELDPDADPASDRGSLAVRELLARPAGNDPDYRSAWPAGWAAAAPVRRAGGVITVDLKPPAGSPDVAGSPGPAGRLATLGIQQLVYTVQDALGSTDPVRILLNGQPADLLWGVPIRVPVARAEPSATRALVQIDEPGQGAVYNSPAVRVRGEAAAFEATVLWQVLRGTAVVAHGHATAAEAFTFSAYQFSVRLAPGHYTLRVYESDESDGEGRPPFADTKDITVVAGGR